MNWIKWNANPEMKYEVKGETETHYLTAMGTDVPKEFAVECTEEDLDRLPDIVDVYIWLANNGKIK